VPAILCAESAEEAQAGIPLFATVFSQLIAGMDLCPNGEDHDLFEKGKRIGTLEIFVVPRPEAFSDGD
jgi:hypothetical protein